MHLSPWADNKLLAIKSSEVKLIFHTHLNRTSSGEKCKKSTTGSIKNNNNNESDNIEWIPVMSA